MKTRKRFLSLCLCLSLLLGLVPAASLTASAEELSAPILEEQYGDFLVGIVSGSVSSSGRYLSLAYGGTYEISMADGVETTDMYIIVRGDSSSNTTITLNGVSISSSDSALCFAASGASGSNQTISLQLFGTNSLVSSEGAGIEKNYYYDGKTYYTVTTDTVIDQYYDEESSEKVYVYETYNVYEFGTGDLRISGTGSLTATGGAVLPESVVLTEVIL